MNVWSVQVGLKCGVRVCVMCVSECECEHVSFVVGV